MDQKKCPRCEIEQEIATEFFFIKATGYYQSWCKSCMREVSAIKYKERKQKEKEEKTDPKKIFADILERKRLTTDDDNV